MKDGERRVALTPSSVSLLCASGADVVVQSGAGSGSGFSDDDYAAAGASMARDASQVWSADLVVKVKEPVESEYVHLRSGLSVFSYLHLAADRPLAEAILASGADAYAFETLREGPRLPLLSPMSEVAGRAAALVAAGCLSSASGGSGVLAGGAAGALPARAVVVGMGVAGTMASRGLRGLDAHVTGVDVDMSLLRSRRMDGTLDATCASEPGLVSEVLRGADILVGAALVPGARAPVVVSEEQVALMRPGGVVVDLAIDQGGCIATSRPTSLSSPTFVSSGILHYCVTNVPGQFARTSSSALSSAVAPRVLSLSAALASGGAEAACLLDDVFGSPNVISGAIVNAAVAASFPDLPARLG